VTHSRHFAGRTIIGGAAAALAAAAVARSKSYATASTNAVLVEIKTQDEEDEEDNINVKALKAELLPVDPHTTEAPNTAKVPSTETPADRILREHIHFLDTQIKDLCVNPNTPEKGLSMKLIKRNSATLKDDIKTFTHYFMEAHS